MSRQGGRGSPFGALLERIREHSANVAVMGLGHVGLPLAVEVAQAGLGVIGFDTDAARVEALLACESYLSDVDTEALAAQLSAGRLRPTTEPDALGEADVIVICVPTPLRFEMPDMTCIERAGRMIAASLRPGRLVILESTTYPGTTEDYLLGILETSGLRCGTDFLLGFSPERIDPGNPRFKLANTPKIVAGVDEEATRLMEAFYSIFIEKVIRVSSPRVAEMAKLLENTYRHVNIALVNEMAILCHDLAIDVWEVIDAAASKPFGFQPFYPGPGWGGHCIPVDPAHLSWHVRQMGQTAHFIELARDVNNRMPAYIVERIAEALNQEGKPLKGSTILILGVAYKPDVADTRESPAHDILGRLRQSGARVQFHDPHVDVVELEDGSLHGIDLDEGALRRADIVVVVTNHSAYDWELLARQSSLILDTRNALSGLKGRIIRL